MDQVWPADHVCVDACYRDGHAALAVVKFRFGKAEKSHRKIGWSDSSTDAERAAIEWAFGLYPGVSVYSDCLSVAEAMGVNWIPRERNRPADRLSQFSIDHDGQPIYCRKSPRHSRKHRMGRGAAPFVRLA